jgi:hypothetical protein
LGALLTVAAAPILAAAQATKRRVAWFGAGRADTPSPVLTAFRSGMRDSGWIEDQNLALSVFLTDGTPEEAERLARQMLATNPEIIVVFGRDVNAVHRANRLAPLFSPSVAIPSTRDSSRALPAPAAISPVSA